MSFDLFLSYRRVISRGTADISKFVFSFLSPAHKAAKYSEGNRILITQRNVVLTCSVPCDMASESLVPFDVFV